MPSKNPPRNLNCAVPRCPRRRRIQPNARSMYCSTHGARSYRYGDPTMRAIRPRTYEAGRAYIREALGRYRNSKAVASALKLAEGILQYVPDYGYTWQHNLQKRMHTLAVAGVKPLDVVQRVVEHFQLVEIQPHLFKTRRTEHMMLARHVLHLTRWGTWRPNTRLLISLGAMLSDDLGLFALQLLRRAQQDLAKREALRRDSADFDTKDSNHVDP